MYINEFIDYLIRDSVDNSSQISHVYKIIS